MKSLLFTLSTASLTLLGCSHDEQLAPAPAVVADAGPDAPANTGADASVPVEVDAGSARRTVMTRSPFGGPIANHFADGDFELSTSQGQGQYGARAYSIVSGGGAVDFAVETGGICRSGLRCAIFTPKTAFLLRGAAAPLGKGNLISFRARVPAGKSCTAVSGLMVTCDTLQTGHGVKATTPQPDAAGWCSYGSRLAPSPSALCLYIQNKLGNDESALLDSAVMGPDDGTVLPQAAEFFVPTAELVAELAAVHDTIRRTTVFGRPLERPNRSAP